jgi:hypothetical protein
VSVLICYVPAPSEWGHGIMDYDRATGRYFAVWATP